MSVENYKLLANVTIASALIPAIISIRRFGRLANELKLLLLLTGVSFICDVTGFFLIRFHLNNYALNVYVLIEFVLLLSIFYIALRNEKLKIVFVVLGLLYTLLFLANLIFGQKNDINSYPVIGSSLTFILLSIWYFYKLMQDLPSIDVYRLPMFWVCVGILVYFSGNLFLFSITQYLVEVLKDNLLEYWSFHNVITLTKNVSFALAIYYGTRKMTAAAFGQQ